MSSPSSTPTPHSASGSPSRAMAAGAATRYSGRQLSDFAKERGLRGASGSGGGGSGSATSGARTLSSVSVGSHQLSHLHHHYTSLSRSPFALSPSHHVKIDNRAAIVLEVGSRLTRIGLAGEFVPREIFRSEYLDPLYPHEAPKSVFPDASGDGGKEKRDDAEQQLLLVKFFKDIVFRKLLTTMLNRRVVVVESLLTPTKHRDAIARALFECPSLSPHSILFAPSHLLATLPFNARTCLVLDVGVREAVLLPLADGYLMLHSWATTPMATAAVEAEIARLMLAHGRVRTRKEGVDGRVGEEVVRPFNKGDLPEFERLRLAEDVMFRFCFATTMERGHALQAYILASSSSSDASTKQPSSLQLPPPPPDVELPFGHSDLLIVPGLVREAAAEVLFADDGYCGDAHHEDVRSLPKLLLDCIRRVPIDLKRPLLANLLVTGGAARMPGLLHRLKEELQRLCTEPHNEYAGELARLAGEVRFYRTGEHNVNVELYGAWLGASMFAALDHSVLDARTLTRERWFAQGGGDGKGDDEAEVAVSSMMSKQMGEMRIDATADDVAQAITAPGGRSTKEKEEKAPSMRRKAKRTVPDWTTCIDDYHKAL